MPNLIQMDFFNGNVFGLDQVHPVTVVLHFDYQRATNMHVDPNGDVRAGDYFVVTTQEDSHHMKHLEMPYMPNGILMAFFNGKSILWRYGI